MSTTIHLALDALRASFRDGPFHDETLVITGEQSLYEIASEGLETYLQSHEGFARLGALERSKGQPAAIAAIVKQGRSMVLEAILSQKYANER